MARSPSYPYAHHLRKQVQKELPELASVVLDAVSHAMAIASTLASSSSRNVMILNVGDALSIDPKLDGKTISKDLRLIGDDVLDAVLQTGQCIVSKRKTRKTIKASNILSAILEDLAEMNVKSAFLIEAMDDGQVRASFGNPVRNGLCGPSTDFHHFEDLARSKNEA
jgi:hypothetical protein